MADETLNLPPFPLLRWDQCVWVGEVRLPSWAGFQARRGGYGAVSSKKPSDGTVSLMVGVVDDSTPTPPTAAQREAMQHLLDSEAEVATVVLQALFEDYPAKKAAYETFFGKDNESLPEIDDSNGLRTVLGLANVHILAANKGGVAYVGFEFGCAWDREHGAGVMTHLDRVVTVGGADCSFLEWIAEEDADGTQGRP